MAFPNKPDNRAASYPRAEISEKHEAYAERPAAVAVIFK